MNRKIFRRSILCVSLLGLIAYFVGRSEKTIPTPVVPASSLPFELTLTVNEQETVDPSTVVEVLAGKSIRVFGTLKTKPGEAFARSWGKGASYIEGVELTPLPDPRVNYVPSLNRQPPKSPPPDKPEHLHVMLMAVVFPFGTEPKNPSHSEFAQVGEYVDPGRKLLTFSGGVLCPLCPGTYTLRIMRAYKYERDFRKNDDRWRCGEYRPIREITLISTKAPE